jgi:hypothetical protein
MKYISKKADFVDLAAKMLAGQSMREFVQHRHDEQREPHG